MIWTDYEITERIRLAKNPAEMVEIVAECNAVNIEDIEELLERNKITAPKRRKKKPRGHPFRPVLHQSDRTGEIMERPALANRYGTTSPNVCNHTAKKGFYESPDGQRWYQITHAPRTAKHNI